MRIDVPIRRQSRISLTPLIDVIFLLLLFFMLSSTFSRYSEVSFSGGGNQAATALDRPDVIVSVGDGEIKLNGVVVPLDNIDARLGDLQDAGAKHVLVIVGSTSASQDFVAAMAEIGKSGLPATVARQSR